MTKEELLKLRKDLFQVRKRLTFLPEIDVLVRNILVDVDYKIEKMGDA